MNENRMAPICIVVFGWWLCFRSKWGHTQVGEAARRDLVRALHAVERSQRLGNAGRRIEQTPGREWHPLSKVQLPVCAEPRGMHALYVHPVQIRVLQWVWPALPHGSSLRCRSFLRQTGSALSPPSQLPFLPSWQGTPRSPAPLTGNLLFIGSYPLSSQHFISKKKKSICTGAWDRIRDGTSRRGIRPQEVYRSTAEGHAGWIDGWHLRQWHWTWIGRSLQVLICR